MASIGQGPNDVPPAKLVRVFKRSVPPVISPPSLIDDFRKLVSYAGDAYCTDLVVGSKVGGDHVGTVLWTRGDGGTIQRVYIAYSSTLSSIVVSYEGTNKTSFGSFTSDITFALISPWKGLEWLGPDVKIARGFQEAWDDSAQQVLDQVRLAKDRYPDARITTTGHSLGGAIALLGALHLSHFLSADVKVVVFGMPRVGNREFANAVDQYLPDQNHIVNYKDPVPHMPAMILGFRHPLGEIWIANEQGDLVYQCPGYENEHCSDSVSGYDLLNHSGPYFGQNVECTAKPPA